jgi:hypothetical protein
MDLTGNGLRGQGVVAGDHLDPDAGAATGLDGPSGTRAWRIHHGLKPQKHETFGTLGLFEEPVNAAGHSMQAAVMTKVLNCANICIAERDVNAHWYAVPSAVLYAGGQTLILNYIC